MHVSVESGERTFRETPSPKVTSPATVKRSSSRMSGSSLNRFTYSDICTSKKDDTQHMLKCEGRRKGFELARLCAYTRNVCEVFSRMLIAHMST